MGKERWLLRWFRNRKLGQKIIYTFILAAVIPLLAVQSMMLYVVSNDMKVKVDDLMVSRLAQISESTNLTLDIYTNLVYQIYSDDDIMEGISAYKAAGPGERARTYREICDRIQQYGTSVGGIECISIILPDGQGITYDFALASAVDNLWSDYPDKTATAPYVRASGNANMAISPTERFARDGPVQPLCRTCQTTE